MSDEFDRGFGIRAGLRRGEGWWGCIYLPTRYGASGRSVEGASLWGLVKFFVIPTRYYVWRYERGRRAA